MKTRTLLAAIGLGLLALLVIGCGGPSLMDALTADDDGDNGGGTEPTGQPAIRIYDVDDAENVALGGTVDYGDQWAVYTREFEIHNDGDASLTLASTPSLRVTLSGSGGDFSVQTYPATDAILPSNKETFEITFTPDNKGFSDTAIVAITSNDPDTPTFQFEVTGFAIC